MKKSLACFRLPRNAAALARLTKCGAVLADSAYRFIAVASFQKRDLKQEIRAEVVRPAQRHALARFFRFFESPQSHERKRKVLSR